MRVTHEFGSFYHSDSKILILGSFPSVKSREVSFYYGHPQNRFWKVLSACFNQDCPITIEEKKLFLKRNQIALWDVIEECDIVGSSDASIKNVKPTDLNLILANCPIEMILVNGKTAMKYFVKYHKYFEIPVYCMSSTSPANAKMKVDDLIREWNIITNK